MRDRLVAALIGTAMAVIALYGIPRAYLLADLVGQQEERKVERSAELLTFLVTERGADSEPVTEEFLQPLLNEGETIQYVAPDGSRVLAGPEPGEDDLVEERTLPDGGRVTLSRSAELISQRVSEAILPLVLIGLGLTLVAGVLGYVMARRLARPFLELAEAADHLGAGRFDEVHVPHYTVAEAEAIGAALRRGSEQLGELVQREREFTANASHQLRTPITALRLELEDLAMWPETPPQVAEELNSYLPELDRLSSAITEILDLARGRRLGDAIDVDLDALVATVVERWTPQAEGLGRRLEHAHRGTVPARLVPGPVLQVLDVLVENALSHGSGVVRVHAQDKGTHVQVEVCDEGPRTIDDSVFRRGNSSRATGSGLGLAIAADLAESLDGYLRLVEAPTTTFALVLPGPGTRGSAGR